MILYWVTTEDHYEDWFVVAPSPDEKVILPYLSLTQRCSLFNLDKLFYFASIFIRIFKHLVAKILAVESPPVSYSFLY